MICTVALGEDYRETVRPCLASQERYAQAQGYDYARLTAGPGRMDRHPSWYKIPLIYMLLKSGYQRVFYIDADALITNPAMTLNSYFDAIAGRKKALHLAEDDDGINMGVFFMDDGADALRLLDLLWIYDLGKHRANWEQAALKDLMNAYAQVRNVVSLAPSARAFNSFPREREALCRTRQENNWARGDFVCHFSGIPGPDLGRLIRRCAADCEVEAAG